MESAIPEHLQTARTRHRRVGDDYAPPYPSFVARHKPSVTRVVMAYFGLQSRGAPPAAAEQALSRLAADFATADGPTHWDRASYVDEAGFTNVVTWRTGTTGKNSIAGFRPRASAGPASSGPTTGSDLHRGALPLRGRL
jgi:hypothetical protein